jgi:Archaeal fructose-1,6-bisphosphatase and related enzymes of inositol monophosphatase family
MSPDIKAQVVPSLVAYLAAHMKGGMPTTDIKELFRLLARIAIDASKFARERSDDQSMSRILSKNPAGDITRRIDREIENYVYDAIKQSGINALIITEESGMLYTGRETPEYIILLDPLDGSINYIANVPYCSVSIAALLYKESVSVYDIAVGVVSEIFRDKYYSFIKGVNAIIDGEPASKYIVDIRDAILVYFEEPDLIGRIYKIWLKLDKPKIRSLGSASLDIIYTSIGRFKAFIDLRGRLRNVDVAAAIGFAREVGAHITDDKGRHVEIPLDRLSNIGSIVVTRSKEIVELLKSPI